MGNVTVVFMGFEKTNTQARSCHPPHQTPCRAATATAAGGNATCTAGIEGATLGDPRTSTDMHVIIYDLLISTVSPEFLQAIIITSYFYS